MEQEMNMSKIKQIALDVMLREINYRSDEPAISVFTEYYYDATALYRNAKEKTREELVNSVREDFRPYAGIVWDYVNNKMSSGQKTELKNMISIVMSVIDPKNKGTDGQKIALNIILNKIDDFTQDESQKVALLNKMRQNLNSLDMRDKIDIMMINAPYVSIRDKTKAVIEYQARIHPDNTDAIKQVISEYEQVFMSELDKGMPDIKAIKDLISGVKDLLNHISITNDDTKDEALAKEQYKQEIEKKFDLDKLLTNGKQHIIQTNQDLETRAVQAESRAKRAEQRMQETQAMYDADTAALQTEKRKNEQLIEQLNEMQRQLEKQQNMIKSIKMRIATQEVGMFGGRAVKEIKEYVNQITEQIR